MRALRRPDSRRFIPIGALVIMIQHSCGGATNRADSSGLGAPADAGAGGNRGSQRSGGSGRIDSEPGVDADRAGLPEPMPDADSNLVDPDEAIESLGTGNDAIGSRYSDLEGDCPVSKPAIGTDCGGLVRWCSYGEDPLYRCRPTYYCSERGWRQAAPPEVCDLSAECPSSSLSTGKPCTPELAGRVCATSERVCQCESLERGPEWSCDNVRVGQECPVSAPNQGVACPTQGLACEYGGYCLGGATTICRGGWWTILSSECTE